MDFSYKQYVKRFQYNPYQWPPDIGLAELHSRCSEPGPNNPEGVTCPCCNRRSKLKMKSWWKRSINQDFSEAGGAVNGYFFLVKYYIFFIFLVLCINTIYPLYSTYFVCQNYDPHQLNCVKSGVLYYLDYNKMTQILDAHNHHGMTEILEILQIVVFYILLVANNASIIILNQMRDKEYSKESHSIGKNILLIHGIKEEDVPKINEILSQDDSIKVLSVIPLKEVKRFYQLFHMRNKTYYSLLSAYVSCDDPLTNKKKNKILRQITQEMKIEKEKLTKYSDHVLVVFGDEKMADIVHKNYYLPQWRKWISGVKSLAQKYKLLKEFGNLPLFSMRVPQVDNLRWQNLGEGLQKKMATKITSFLISIAFIVLCYALLYIPMKFSLLTHAEKAYQIKLSTFQKIIPIITSLALFGLSVLFRLYMEKLSERRNPRNQMEKSKFVLLNCVLFHFIFYLIIPTLYFTFNNGINQSIKLYVVSEQARTFIICQLILSIIDMPYRIWRSKRSLSMSDQRQGFKNAQIMLHKKVQYRDYPLEIRLQTLFRIWSFALFYSFFLPYMMMYMVIALIILFWLEKRNLYFHYSLRRKIDISLEYEFLMVYVNFFCIYQCFIYVFNANGFIKIILAIVFTVISVIANVGYWICFNPDNKKKFEKNNNQEKLEDEDGEPNILEAPLINSLDIDGSAYKQSYENFLNTIQIQKLNEEISAYLEHVPVEESNEKDQKISKIVELEMEEFQEGAQFDSEDSD